MTAADKVTSIRIILAPVFFILYMLPAFNLPFGLFWVSLSPESANFPRGFGWTVPVLWLIFVVSEISDLIDGKLARSRNEVSDFGKFYDPFADTLVQLTNFLCFVMDGILPVILLLIFLYREFSVLFIRNLMLRKGVAMGARMGGKIKTVVYIASCALALLAASFKRLGQNGAVFDWTRIAAIAFFSAGVVLAIVSFFDYASVYRGAKK
ncbi:MAG: CDP-diacylglycerol--glycerol-3-phosphate 3-phosphatidyltransferase [Spirochaetaceae bacterium]|jgi:CDP-diacylglycerol--glycerol-3-phosphate 3-phosphatidyltransferase|nr:CDP-diacylglycerol--glycerol-3-phosphate 3-phosphatidyltransferase [Spirochaetaceae bacterium]